MNDMFNERTDYKFRGTENDLAITDGDPSPGVRDTEPHPSRQWHSVPS